jgi:hypothetical protein
MTYVTICSYRSLELIDSYSHYNPTSVGFGTIFSEVTRLGEWWGDWAGVAMLTARPICPPFPLNCVSPLSFGSSGIAVKASACE